MAMGGDGTDRPLASQPSLAERAPMTSSLLSLSRNFHSLGSEMLRRIGLYPGQELILMRLIDEDEQTQTALQAAIGLNHSTVSRSIRRMEDAGLITRRRADRDKRAMIVSLTTAGQSLAPELDDLWGSLEAVLRAELTQSDTTALLQAFSTLSRSLALARRSGI